MQLSACRLARLTALAVLLPGAAPPREGSLEDALQSIKPDAILQHIKVLASDEYEGRGPGTPGEDKTIAYLTGQLRAMGLKPGNPDGSYVQNVPLVGFQATRVAGSFRAGGKTIELAFPKNFVAMPGRAGEQPKIDDSEVVFVGHGVVAPEYGWDDFKGLDVRGKTLIMLVGDPPVPDPHDSSKLDPAMFKGRAMTYYGRWTYKYEIAAKLGASAAILVHEDGPAGYPFSVVQGSWSRENFDIVTSGSVAPAPAVPVKGWIDSPTAKALCLAAGQDLAALKLAAVRRDFRPVVLNARARFDIEVKARQVQSHNVIARLEGSDQALKNQYVVYTAHWDHLGIDPNLKGDQIYNGAADNASGVAAVLEIARAFTHIRPIPKRSLLFLFVTAEEKGLLGSKYYASASPLPPGTDPRRHQPRRDQPLGANQRPDQHWHGPVNAGRPAGRGCPRRGRTVGPDAEPEKGYYYRSDHFEFAKQGVPALDPKSGRQYIDKPADYAKQKQDEYTEKNYHKVSDEVKPDWDLSGAAEDLKAILEVGYRVAEGDRFPEWKPDSEFRARREAMLGAGRR